MSLMNITSNTTNAQISNLIEEIGDQSMSACEYASYIIQDLQGYTPDPNSTSRVNQVAQFVVTNAQRVVGDVIQNPSLITPRVVTKIVAGGSMVGAGIYCGIEAMKKTYEAIVETRDFIPAITYAATSLGAISLGAYLLHATAVEIALSPFCSGQN